MARVYHNVEYCVTITAWVCCWDGHLPEFQTQSNAVSTRWTYQGFLQSFDTASKHKHCMCNRVLGDGSPPDGFWPWEPEAEGNILLCPTSFTIPQLAVLWSISELLPWILLLSIIPRLPVFTNYMASSVTALSNWSMHQANGILPHDPCLSPEFPMPPTVFFIHKPNFVKQWAEEHFWNFCFKSHRCLGLSVCLGIWEVVETLFQSVHSDKGVLPLYDMSLALQIIAWDCHWVSHVMIPWHLQTQLNKNNEATYHGSALQLQSHWGLKVGVNFRMLSLLKWHEPSFHHIVLC